MNYFMELNCNRIDREIDAHCKKLCDDMILFWNKRCQQVGTPSISEVEAQPKPFQSLAGSTSYSIWQKTKPEEVKMTCDFIGPSQYYAEEQGLVPSDILIYNIRARVFGGHMIWPSKLIDTESDGKQKKSINTGRSRCFKERIDYTLLALKTWYSQSEPITSPEVEFHNILSGNSAWLKSFGKNDDGYRYFINFFALNDFVTTDTYTPYDLSSFSSGKYCATINEFPAESSIYVPNGRENFQKLINGCQHAIDKRECTIIALMKI